MRREQVLELMIKYINEKVKQNWDDDTNVTHDIATIITLVKVLGYIDEFQVSQLFNEANSGYQLTCSFLLDLGLINR